MDFTCSWCGERFTAPRRPGPPPRYCRPSHRQRAYEARRRAGRAGREREDVTGVGPPLRPSRFDVFIRVLGQVEANGRDVESIPLGPRMRAVLAVLALRPRQTVSVEKLIDDVWPGVNDEAARHRLHTVVSKLRNVLAPDAPEEGRRLIRGSEAGYALDVSDDQLDWVRFHRLLDAGEGALQRGEWGLAKSYLSAALSLWSGPEPLTGVEVPVDDVGFVTARIAGRERALRQLIEARLLSGEYDEVIHELEARVAADPIDADSVRQLALAHYRSGRPERALAVCDRYLQVVVRLGALRPAMSVTDLQRAILRRDPEVGAPRRGDGAETARRQPSGHSASLSCRWELFTASPGGPLPAELHLIIERHGGSHNEATESSIEASFEEVRSALEGALALQRALGQPPFARVGIEVHPTERLQEAFEAPSRARARLLAAAAGEGQILVTDLDGGGLVERSLPRDVELRPLGSHRLNALAPPSSVFQLIAQGLPAVDARPRWLHRHTVHNLAEDPFRLVGRDRDVEEVTELLTENRWVTLVGAPGSGKTRLAAHIAAGLSEEFADGAWFVALQPVSQPELVVTAVADALGVPRAGQVEPEDAIVRHLKDRQMLLVLDNCEHLISGCRVVIEHLISACPGATVLATSRQGLGASGEIVIVVAPLDPPSDGSSDVILQNAAVQLFYDRIQAGRSDSVPRAQRSPPEVMAVGRICRAVDGIPLALVLAAARAREVGVLALADAIDEELGEGAGPGILSPVGAVETTLEDTLEWSYRLLGNPGQRLLETLSVFRSGFTLDDASAVSVETDLGSRREVLAALDRLVQASLVTMEQTEEGLGRFRLLQPIREYAGAKLALQPDRLGAVGRRHAEHFLSLIEEAEPNLHGRQERAVLDRVEASLPDLYAAIRWAIGEEEAQMALRLVGGIWVFWLVRGRTKEGLEFLEAALAADRSISTERAKALIACSQMAWFTGVIHRVRYLCREALAIAEALDDAWAWAWGPLGIAAVEMFGTEDDGVPQRIEELLPGFRALGNDWDTGQAIQTLGGAAWHRGQYERAEQALSESTALYKSLGHPTLMASLLAHGLVLALQGRVEEGAAEVEQSIGAAYEAGDLIDLGYALTHRGSVARYAGQHDLARHYYREALRIAVTLGQAWMVQWALGGLAGTEDLGADTSTGRLSASVQLLARAAALARETGITLAPWERDHHTQDIDRLRHSLGDGAFRAAFARGERLSIEEAVELALHLE